MTSDRPPAQPEALTSDEAGRLAESVRRIDRAMREFMKSGLSRKALVVLLHDSTGVSKRDINAVLNGLETLGKDYLDRANEG